MIDGRFAPTSRGMIVVRRAQEMASVSQALDGDLTHNPAHGRAVVRLSVIQTFVTGFLDRHLDIYAADLERIEVLEGPQGTLFGSGAEAGVLRYITNRPKLDVTEGNVNAGYSYTAHGDPNSNVDAMTNLPLIPNRLAVRAVIYNDSRGGYINNVPSTFTRAGTDEGLAKSNNGIVPNDSVSINNNNVLGNAINPVTYQGVRVSGLWKINDEWDALLAQSYQSTNAQGVFYEMPYGSEGVTFNGKGEPIGTQALPPLSVTVFNPSYDRDKFESTSLTVTGKIGDLKAVYSGGYLVRNVDQVQDYTNYARGVYGSYYQCTGLSKTSAATGKCYSPSTTWHETEKNTHQSHEFRLSTPDDWRVRAIGGMYWEEFKIYDDTNWLYKTVPTCTPSFNTNCFNDVQPWPGVPANNPNVRNDNVGFFDDFQRTILQQAAFGSVDVDLIPKTLTFTAGTRYYRFHEEEKGGDVGSFYCKVYAPSFGLPITSVPNVYGPSGSPLANSPPFQANLRARYEFAVEQYRAFFQIGGTHQGNSYSTTGNVPTYDQPGYTLYDASFGVSKDAWAAQIFGQNLTNVLASTFTNSSQWIEQERLLVREWPVSSLAASFNKAGG
jgi:outer membrane receptor protein involved in Fe transport